MSHDFLSVYDAKMAEYLLAVSYLVLFIPFWRYVQSARTAPATATVMARAETPAAARQAPARKAPAARPAAGWFTVPGDVYLHPGHTWARLEADGTVAIGLDDLAHRLVAAESTTVPSIGAHVAQGDAAIDLTATGKRVSALSPVDGVVVAVNPARDTTADPYGAGWLFKVKPAKLAANLRQLYRGSAAKKLLDEAAELLAMRADPAMALVLQDGGSPVHGIAAALAGDEWDTLAREILRS
jgi:glycine cleavage system H lipoate-binding protein